MTGESVCTEGSEEEKRLRKEVAMFVLLDDGDEEGKSHFVLIISDYEEEEEAEKKSGVGTSACAEGKGKEKRMSSGEEGKRTVSLLFIDRLTPFP